MAAAAVAAFLFTPWLPVLAAQLGVIDRLEFWVPAFSIANLGKVYLAYTGLLFNMASWTFYLPARVWVLAALGLFFAIALWMGIRRAATEWRASPRRGPRGAVIWLAVGLGVPWVLSLWKAGIF